MFWRLIPGVSSARPLASTQTAGRSGASSGSYGSFRAGTTPGTAASQAGLGTCQMAVGKAFLPLALRFLDEAVLLPNSGCRLGWR